MEASHPPPAIPPRNPRRLSERPKSTYAASLRDYYHQKLELHQLQSQTQPHTHPHRAATSTALATHFAQSAPLPPIPPSPPNAPLSLDDTFALDDEERRSRKNLSGFFGVKVERHFYEHGGDADYSDEVNHYQHVNGFHHEYVHRRHTGIGSGRASGSVSSVDFAGFDFGFATDQSSPEPSSPPPLSETSSSPSRSFSSASSTVVGDDASYFGDGCVQSWQSCAGQYADGSMLTLEHLALKLPAVYQEPRVRSRVQHDAERKKLRRRSLFAPGARFSWR